MQATLETKVSNFCTIQTATVETTDAILIRKVISSLISTLLPVVVTACTIYHSNITLRLSAQYIVYFL